MPDYLSIFATDPRVRLTAVYDGDPRWRHPIPSGVAARCQDAAQALSHADAALIASTTAEHEGLLDAVLEARLPALVEKPLAANAVLAERMASRIQSPSVTTAMFLRQAPAVRRLRALYDDGFVGPACEVFSSFSHNGLDAGFFTGAAEWMLDPECGAVGGFADLGIHLIDLMHWLLRESDSDYQPSVVRARIRRRVGTPLDVGGGAVLDWRGVRVSVRAAWDENPGGLHIEIRGPRGTLAVHDTRLEIKPVDGRRPSVEWYPPHRASAALEAFIDDLCFTPSGEAANTRDLTACAKLLDRIYRRADAR